MTVQDVTSEVSFTGNAVTTSFPFVFRVDDVTWLSLSYLVNFDQITLNGNQELNPGGSVDYLAAPPADQQIILTRNVPLTQLMDYTRHGPFDSESHESALDKLTMAIQDRDKNTAQKSKSATIENPDGTEDITLFFTPVALEVSEIRAVLRGGLTPSMTWTLRYGPDRDAVGTEIITGGTVTTDVNTGDDITVFDNPSVPVDNFIWLETTAQGGTVHTLHITIRYTEVLP